MKHRNNFKKVIIYLFGIVIACLLGMGFVKNSAFYQSADRNFFSFISMLRYGLIEEPVATVGGIFKDTATMWDVRYENDRLRTQLETSQHWQTRVNDLEKEVHSLKALNDLKSVHTDYSMIPASVKNRSVESWDSVVIIDKGSEDGISVDDGVMAPKGVVGRVVKTDKHQSIVSLLVANDDTSSVTVQIEVSKGNYVQGILDSYDHEKGLFKIVLLEATSTVAKDMNVSTASISSIFPSGLYVGKVDSVKNVADSVGVLVYVKPEVNFANIDYVSVVKKP